MKQLIRKVVPERRPSRSSKLSATLPPSLTAPLPSADDLSASIESKMEKKNSLQNAQQRAHCPTKGSKRDKSIKSRSLCLGAQLTDQGGRKRHTCRTRMASSTESKPTRLIATPSRKGILAKVHFCDAEPGLEEGGDQEISGIGEGDDVEEERDC
jgi:hypothetical protein